MARKKKESLKMANLERLEETMKREIEESSIKEEVVEKESVPVQEEILPKIESRDIVSAPEPEKKIVLTPTPTTKRCIGIKHVSALSIGPHSLAVIPGKEETYPISLANSLIAMGLVREV
jgi:hypothetical protein